MKKAIVLLLIIPYGGLYAAGCELYSGFAESDEYVFFAKETDVCPNGYAETEEFVIVGNSENCPDGYEEAPEYKEVVCDSSKGVCISPIEYVCS